MALSAGPISASLLTNYEYYTSDGINQGLNTNQSYFTLNDELVRIYSGAMHYFRVPRASWRDRLKIMRASGLNTVETYVPWNLHEPQPGHFDFGDDGSEFVDFLHLEEFLKTAKEEDLFVILRTGPYNCSEYHFSSFPAWLRERTMGIRTSEPTYMKFVTRYFNILLTLLAAFQFTKGGPIIAFQVEKKIINQEAGVEFQPDKPYLEPLRQLFINNGLLELLVTSDSPLSHQGKCDVCDHVLVLVNGAPKQLKYASELNGFGFYRLKNSNVTLNQEAINGSTLDIVVDEWERINGEKFDQCNKQDEGPSLNLVELMLELFVYTYFFISMLHPNIRQHLTKQ